MFFSGRTLGLGSGCEMDVAGRELKIWLLLLLPRPQGSFRHGAIVHRKRICFRRRGWRRVGNVIRRRALEPGTIVCPIPAPRSLLDEYPEAKDACL